ncbi:MAG: glycoside hydrolase family 9 protein [Anaeromyxobacter sp.]
MLQLNREEYLEAPGLGVRLGHDDYPEGHQGGVTVVQHGHRVAANGDLRLDRTPGQWQPTPSAGPREVDRAADEVRVRCRYPDPEKDRRGFNPITYPPLRLDYTLSVRPDGEGFRLRVALDAPVPAAWLGRVALQLELFPGHLFGRAWIMEGPAGERAGLFPRQPDGPGTLDAEGAYQIAALAEGRRLTVAPESELQRLTVELLGPGLLELVDGRGQHPNGWFIVRSPVPAGATEVEWRVTPHAVPGFLEPPVVQVSQVGYPARSPKVAVLAHDPRDPERPEAVLARLEPSGARVPVLRARPAPWGRFLSSEVLRLDFSAVEAPGLYELSYGAARSSPFRIGPDVLARHVWQPTLEVFLPVQMCHVRVVDRYRVWHGACHLDDARMAPVDHLHFDGYAQGPSTLCRFAPGAHVPGLDQGGWHDAGDHDLRVESQVETVRALALAREAFGVDHDGVTVDEARRLVELGRPDGQPDVLQQLRHGLRSVVGGCRALGRPYRGIIEATLAQYTLTGDPVNATDGRVLDPRPPSPGAPAADDRWVFTEEAPDRELLVAAGLAAAARVLPGFDDALAAECLGLAAALWEGAGGASAAARAGAAVELLLATGEARYRGWLEAERAAVCARFAETGWLLARALGRLGPGAAAAAREAARAHAAEVRRLSAETPYGVPYRPAIWGHGWAVQAFGREQYYLHRAFPDLYDDAPVFHALAFVLGCHPGANGASFVSGVGARSVTSAYGLNRADGGHVPGGSVSGTALIRPDLPELLDWPYLWQQAEYVVGGAADFLFLALAADDLARRRG